MRSPPMRHASLHIEGAVKSTEFRERRRSSSAQGIPQYVTDDLEWRDLKDYFYGVGVDRDRRLRLLIRRYVNQILHGCQNRNCTVPTCLSYRKRNSKGPLRGYTDLSARTLACHLVDEYSQAGKDPSHGLCQSQPIVPWYEAPTAQHQRRRHDRSPKEHDTKCNGHVPESAQLRRRSSAARDSDPSSATHEESTTTMQTTMEELGTCVKINNLQPPHVDVNAPERNSKAAEISEDDLEFIHGKPSAGTTGVWQDDDIASPAQRKDLSSFVQSVWDTLSLRTLFQRLPCPKQTSASTNSVQALSHFVDDDSPSSPSCEVLDSRTELDFTSTAFCGLTLRRLSWKTLTWLVDVRYDAPQHQSTSFEIFLRQSLYNNLSNPYRLYNSAQSWNDDPDAAEDEGTGVDPDADLKREAEHGYEALSPLRSGIIHTHRIMPTQRFDIDRSLDAFDMLTSLSNGTDLVYNALHVTLQQCYTLGLPRRSRGKQPQGLKLLKRSGGGLQKVEAAEEPTQQPMGKTQVAEIFLAVLMASLGPLFSEDLITEDLVNDDPADVTFKLKHILASVADMRNDNRAYPVVVYGSTIKEDKDVRLRQLLIDIIDHFEDWHLLRLTTSLMDCISHHLAAAAVRRTHMSPMATKKLPRNVLEIMLDRLCEGLIAVESDVEAEFRKIIGLGIIELARSILLKEWDRTPIIRRTGAVGGALELLAAVFRRNHSFHVRHWLFYMPFIAQTFDEMEMPVQWQSFQPNEKEVHVLSFSFLFEPWTLVKYFRSVNVNAMRRAHESAAAYSSDARQFLGNTVIPVYGGKEVLAAIRPHMAKYLVLTIRRSNVLEDALNQLWRRQRREILRPLRVRLGKDEGEDGLDHGGVQQEFFRLAFAEAFRPEYGMFTVDDTTRMTWFQPGSLEPLYKFEAIGILMSLAVYNAVTLPITFPLAFYRMLLGLKVKKLEHIKDGWPVLAKGLKTLLDFDGDVGEVISRTYEFSYDFSGSTVTVDMQKRGRDDPWPPIERASRKGKEKAKSASFELPVQLDITPPSLSPAIAPLSRTSSLKGISTPLSLESEVDEDSATVTNETREQYVKDYVFWLTDKSIRPQFEAFHKGFLTCLDPSALSMFTPEALREVMEGHRDIDIDELERTATYEEYEKTSDYMNTFWQVVRSFSTEQHRQLLEFVTASDRVPVNGLESIQFIVQRNGDDDARLPSSSTCYGRLLLPEYSDRGILEEKLTKALENSLGFGSL